MIGGAPVGGTGGALPGKNTEEAHSPTSSQTPEQSLLSRETEACIWRAFQQLSQRQQEVFALRYVDEWSTEEVAKILGITTGSVKRYLFRAVHHLRRALGDRR